jgi:intron-binding protein aquarius
MAGPLKLHIVPQETFPTQRLNNAVPQGTPLEVEDMPQMAAFVYEFYIQKVQAMKSAFYVSTWFLSNRMICSKNLKYVVQ